MEKEMTYMESVHRDGKIWGLAVAALIILFPVALCFIFSAVPKWDALAEGLIATLPMYWAVGFIEIFTYVPMLGAGGAYLSFVTGNISNLKLPCALNALENAEVKAQSEEGIAEVRWLSGEALFEALKLSYATIKEVVERYTRKR